DARLSLDRCHVTVLFLGLPINQLWSICPDGECVSRSNSEAYIPAMRCSLLCNGLAQTVGCQREQSLVPFVQMHEMGEIDVGQCECEQSGEGAVVTDHLENGYPHGLFCQPPVTRPQCHDGTAAVA